MDLVILLALIALNGVFALSELAIVSSRRNRLQMRADKGDRGAKVALKLQEDPSAFLSTVQVGITLIGIIAGAYGATALAEDVAPWIVQTFPALEKQAGLIAFGGVLTGSAIASEAAIAITTAMLAEDSEGIIAADVTIKGIGT